MKSIFSKKKCDQEQNPFVNDLSKGNMILIFSEESSRAIYEMGNIRLIELRRTSATIQSFLPEARTRGIATCVNAASGFDPIKVQKNRIRAAFVALKTPYFRSTATLSGVRKWAEPLADRSFKSHDTTRGATKRGEYTSFLDRYQNEEVYWPSHLVHGLTQHWSNYLDYIS